MEDFEAVAPPPMEQSGDEFCSSVLSQFGKSEDEHHHHVCAAIGAMSQELKDQNIPLTPVAYFGATSSSLDRLCSGTDAPGHILDALTTILFLVIDRFPPVILRKKYVYLSELLIRALRAKSIGVNGIVPGLKVASRLLIVKETVIWEDASQLYCFIISYITDDRTKVRKQSHSCLRDTLEKFILAPVHAPASEAITNVFERCLLLAGGSNSTAPEGPKGAQEILYILDALKFCLPYMSSKPLMNVLKYFKSLLELKHPLVTRRITDGLNALCLHCKGEIPPENLLDLLCTLSNLVISDESSADSMTLTSRLLDAGTKRVLSSNRELCVAKLPLIFNALKDILGSGHEEALVAALATFKSLIHTCIDESLITQGVNNIKDNANSSTRKIAPTVVEKVCATVEGLLDYHYEAVWDISFQIVSTMFDKLGSSSFYLLKGTLKNLADMQKLPEGDFVFRKQLHECIGFALAAMGPENFLCLLPLNLDAPDFVDANLWLFQILKQCTVCAHLKFFTKSILPMALRMNRRSAELKMEGKLHLSRCTDGIVYSLWSLLPSFCNYPVDTAESFKGLEAALCTALQEEPHLRGIICSSLQILIQQNKKVLEGKGSAVEIGSLEKRGLAFYNSDVAHSNLAALKSSALEFLQVLKAVYFQSSKDTSGMLLSTIGELASISDKKVVSDFFKKTMNRLLVVLKAAEPMNSRNSVSMQVDDAPKDASQLTKRAQLFDVAASVLPALNFKEINLLFLAIQTALKDAEGLIQKRAYRVLSLIFQNSDDFISRKLKELLNLMIEVLPACQVSAKRYRLDCLYFMIIYILKEAAEQSRQSITTSFLTEIILALKEANKKTRSRAYDILVQIGRACEEEEGSKNEKLLQFFNMVAGGLAGQTPHMISAAVTGLARLAYEFSDLVSFAYNVLPSTFLLLQRKNKEVIKANLGLIKVLVAKSPVENLRAHLRSIVEGLLLWRDSTRSHFKAKVKLLLEMLVKKCGLDAVKEVMPEEHMKLLSNIRKLNERKVKKQSAKSVDGRSVVSEATTSGLSRWNHTKIFSDFEDAETRDTAVHESSSSGRQIKHSSVVQSRASLLRSKRNRKAAKGLEEDSFEQLDAEPLDLLDNQKTRSALRSTLHLKRKSDSDEEVPEIDSEGRIIIRDDGKFNRANKKLKDEQLLTETETDGRSEAGSRKTQKRRKTSETGWAYTGKEYTSKKGSGDVRRKDKVEPYAYWPLDRKMLSRRPEHRAAARKGMVNIAKLRKKVEGKSVSNALSVKGLGVGFKKMKRKNSR